MLNPDDLKGANTGAQVAVMIGVVAEQGETIADERYKAASFRIEVRAALGKFELGVVRIERAFKRWSQLTLLIAVLCAAVVVFVMLRVAR